MNMMKVTKLTVAISPVQATIGNMQEVRIDVELNGKRETVISLLPHDDFVSRFDWFMEDAKRLIKDKLKNP